MSSPRGRGERDGEDLAPGEDAGSLDDLADDSDALEAWEYAFAVVLDITLEAADDPGPAVADDLDLDGHGPALVTRLFLSRGDAVRITELADALKHAATAGLAAEEADRQWSWSRSGIARPGDNSCPAAEASRSA